MAASNGLQHRYGLLHHLASLLEIVVVCVFVVTFVAQPFRIPSESMQPTLQVGDFSILDKQSFADQQSYADQQTFAADQQSFAPGGRLERLLLPKTEVRRGDLAVFHYPRDPSVDLVKRIVGLPGDRIRLHQGRVLVNGRPLDEPYAFYSAAPPNGFRDEFPSLREVEPNVDPRWWIRLREALGEAPSGDLLIPPGHYFVLGDNRNNSEDSRYWGLVPEADLIGRPLLVYFTLRKSEEPAGWRLWHTIHVLR